jgi:hypothetical protein
LPGNLTSSTAGLILAVLAGTLGALTLAPMQYAPSRERSLRYLPSMAGGIIFLAPVVDVLALAARGKRLELKPRKAAPPGDIPSEMLPNLGLQCSNCRNLITF